MHLLLLRESPAEFGKMTDNDFRTIFHPLSGFNTDIASLLLTVVGNLDL